MRPAWLALVLTSCAAPMGEIEREMAYQQLADDYALCKMAKGGIWVSTFHHNPRRPPSYLDLKFDYNANQCNIVLRSACKRDTPQERC